MAGEDEWLYPGAQHGRRLASPKRPVRTILGRAGLSGDMYLHTFRHRFAARVVSAGHGLHAAAKLSGHTQAATTTHRYAHLERDAQRRAPVDVDTDFARARDALDRHDD